MRDYILHQAESRDRAFTFPVLRRWVRNLFFKRQLRKLASLDDYLLNDIGLTRDDIRYGLRLPYDVDGVDAMETIRSRRMGRGTRHR